MNQQVGGAQGVLGVAPAPDPDQLRQLDSRGRGRAGIEGVRVSISAANSPRPVEAASKACSSEVRPLERVPVISEILPRGKSRPAAGRTSQAGNDASQKEVGSHT